VPILEARALEGIGHAHLHDGNPGEAAPSLNEALTIYQRLGASSARRVQEYLDRHGLTPATPSHNPDHA
jgi:hypothetical protein